jgi:hypothetical protein
LSSASDIETSVLAGDAWLATAASGESATSDKDEVPGLSFVFFEGEGLSVGPGVPETRILILFEGSSAEALLVLKDVNRHQ